MKTSLKKSGILALALSAMVLLIAAPRTAQAVPLNGTITLAHTGYPQGTEGTWYDSFGVSFYEFSPVIASAGDYSELVPGTNTFFGSFIWGNGSGAVNIPLWTLWMPTLNGSTYTFSSPTVTNITRGDAENDFISISGTAILTINGTIVREPTLGSWTFTAGETNTLSFSAGSVELVNEQEGTGETEFPRDEPAVVPEPSSLGILAVGFVSLSLIARRRQASSHAR
jgi:hypothetical protein